MSKERKPFDPRNRSYFEGAEILEDIKTEKGTWVIIARMPDGEIEQWYIQADGTAYKNGQKRL